MKLKRKWILIISLVLIIGSLCVPLAHLLKTKALETDQKPIIPGGYANDVSGLNLTKVDSIVNVVNDKEGIQNQLRAIISYAKKSNIKISIAGARHSMGGQTIHPNGIVINMLPYKVMNLDSENNILTVGSGALWEDVIRYLDQYGKSVSVMQAFSSFTIGGSISVNGHGWQKEKPPVGSSVVSFTLMNSKGEILNCSRTENAELFHLVIGGYGLFGIILDVKLKVVNNVALKYKFIQTDPDLFLKSYEYYMLDLPDAELVFGRLRISKKHFLEEVTLNYFIRVDQVPPPLSSAKSTETKRLVFRGSVNNEYGKRLRWDLETGANKMTNNQIYSRNEVLNDPVSMIENKDTHSTDLLQEYFIPQKDFDQFIKDIKPVLLNSEIDLLNITIRKVTRDDDSYMKYARQDVFGFVFLFNQKKTRKQEEKMKGLTMELAKIALKNHGTYYLPYRLHIDKNTMRQFYPQADQFFQLKLKYDPGELFSNMFYMHYK